jgi:hypothetical protein
VAASFTLVWLTRRKRPGKICRQAADSPLRRKWRLTGQAMILSKNQLVDASPRRGMELA